MKYCYYLLAMLICFGCQTFNQEQALENTRVMREISQNWSYAQVNGELKGKATVPGTIHTDLLAEGKIKDPFYRTNEKDLQWIDKEDWVYTTSFELKADELKKSHLILDFKGLDTYADVYLNDSLILEADNMFREWEVNILPIAKEGVNQLKVYLHSPINKGLAMLEASPYAYPAGNDQSENGGLGDKRVSIFTRKAGYHYGWDWGPRFVTSGIWRPVILKGWDDMRITDVFIKQPSVTKEKASLEAQVTVQVDKAGTYNIAVSHKNGELTSKELKLTEGENVVSLPFTMDNPKLWWSHGLGDAHMYNFKTSVSGNDMHDSYQVATGLRSLKLVREKDEDGESFLFELNGVRVFMKGANYIPNDNFLPRVDKAEYDKVIADAVNANMNMLRVWGGGIYENDYFYELCDKNGLLVWEDFMFACSLYPDDSAFLNSVKQEAIDNVVRLRNHPSIALWCGNNEINTGWHYGSEGGWGWKKEYTTEQQEALQKGYLDVFHKILPEVVEQYTDGDDYWPSSPQAGYEWDKHAGYTSTSGDMHYWGVWHGLHPFEDFEKYKARFMSEYGFQSFPDFETVKKYAEPEDYDIESEVMAAHQRSGIGNLRIREYMSWEYNVPKDFKQFLYMSHVLQARGTKMAIEAHRRAMPYCMGTLYWQINDCWPVASWSSTDYTHKWKAMHYTVKKLYKPVMLSAFHNEGRLEVYGVSDFLEDKEGTLSLEIVDFDGKSIWKQDEEIALAANTSSKLFEWNYTHLLNSLDSTQSVLKMTFKAGDEELANNLYYFAKPKDQKLPTPELKIELVENDGKPALEISTDKLARDIYFNFPDKEAHFSDNYFDLLPGEKRVITIDGASGLSKDDLEIIHLGEIK